MAQPRGREADGSSPLPGRSKFLEESMTYQRLLSVVAVGLAFVSHPTWVQAKSADEPATGEATGSDAPPEGDEPPESLQNEPTAEAGSEESGTAEAKLVADAERGGSSVELPGQTYYFVGARYRLILVPKFIVGLFADGGKSVGVHSGGLEFAIRKDGFEYNLGAWLAAYSMSPVEFKATDDGEDAWELVESKIKILYLTADFMWSHDLTPELALNYGMGAGFGLVFGPLYRNQAYRDGASGKYEECAGVGNPSPVYCGNDNDHYNDYEEPSWSGGGSKPIIFPWLAVQTGIRYKAHRNFVARIEGGFGLSGFFLGVGGDYGL
jgi:hypothetical protein